MLLEAESNPGPQCGRKDYVKITKVVRGTFSWAICRFLTAVVKGSGDG
jgi:hypothetical protein